MYSRLSHGQVARSQSNSGSTEFAEIKDAVAFTRAKNRGANEGRFGYLFAGEGLPATPNVDADFEAVAAAMVDDGQHPGPSGMAAVMTYFGQFIDHDMTINTDSDPSGQQDDDFSISPRSGILTKNPRDKVVATLRNARKGTLRLDSLYGDDTPQDGALRDGAKMRIGETSGGSPFDLPRFAQMPSDIQELLDSQQPDGGKFFPAQAVIGDGRNDENLIVAQLHLAFLRFHNAVVDSLESGDDSAKFAQAAEIVRRHYQWLVIERYLPAIGDPSVVEVVKRYSAPLYTAFAQGDVTPANAPMPLEFSVAGFRFGHSMIRPNYVFNDNFPKASLRELFQFTGKPDQGGGQSGVGFPGATKLVDVWVIDWRNFLSPSDQDRTASPVDTELAAGLQELFGQPDALKSLPSRNLRRSYVLNIPTAQEAVRAINSNAQFWNGEIALQPISPESLRSVPGGSELINRGYGEATPLWFYILAEAQLERDGARLGPLGTLIVAETLIGITALDPTTYWNRTDPNGERWTPSQDPIDGTIVDSLEAMLSFAGVL